MKLDEGRPHKIWLLIVAILLPNVGGWIGAALWQDYDWYETLNKPIVNPPNWLFPIAWTIIYSLMGLASYYVWKSGVTGNQVYVTYGVYVIQLLLNWIWTPLFFIWHLILAAMIDLLILWVLVAVLIFLCNKISKVAAWSLVPYLAWLTVANALNISYFVLNPDA